MLKKTLLIGLLAFVAGEAQASPSYEIAYTTFTHWGVKVTSGTAKKVNTATDDGFKARRAGYRITNYGDDPIFVGGVNVSTKTYVEGDLDDLGEKLEAGDSAVYNVWRDAKTNQITDIYIMASDDAGNAGETVGIFLFGYR